MRLVEQADYWNREADSFHRIYSHRKSACSAWLDRVFRRDMYERFELAMREAAPIAGRTFLDVGCGTGVYCLELARRGAARVTGLDIAGAMLEMARSAAEAEGLGARCEFVRGDLLSFAAATSDVTIGIGLFDYLADPLPVLSRMREVTGDRVILSFPRLNTWRAPVRRARLALRGCPVYFYTRRRIGALLASAGLRPVKIERVGKLYCVVAVAARRERHRSAGQGGESVGWESGERIDRATESLRWMSRQASRNCRPMSPTRFWTS